MPALVDHQAQGRGGRHHVGHRQRIQHAVLTEDRAQDQHHGDQAEHLPAQADEDRLFRLADGLEEPGSHVGEGHQRQQQVVHPHGVGGVPQIVPLGTEDPAQRLGKDQDQDPSHREHGNGKGRGGFQGVHHPGRSYSR